MGLILNSFLKSSYTNITGLSNQYFLVPKQFLSHPFNLLGMDEISGKILEVKTPFTLTQEDITILNDLENKEITLILFRVLLGTHDYLHLDKTTWEMIREYGIIPEQYYFKLKLMTVKTNQVTKSIYPKRDVSVT